MREPVFRGVKPSETNQPAQFRKTIRGMKSVHHNSSFLIFDFKILNLSGVTQTCNQTFCLLHNPTLQVNVFFFFSFFFSSYFSHNTAVDMSCKLSPQRKQFA